MIKLLALSIGISALPLSQRIIPTQNNNPSNEWHFRNNITNNPFETKKENKGTTTEDLKQGSWYANAMQNIEQSEYNFKWEEKLNLYCTPNRKQNLRFFYNEDGFSVEPRTTKIPLEDYEPTVKEEDKKYKYLPTWKVAFDFDKKQMGKGFCKVAENKAEYITENITVQYINTKEGMRQNFIVQKPLQNNDELNINFNIKTKLKTYLHSNQLQFFHNKTNVLNYQQLKVWDANGKILTASFKKNKKNNYYIKVYTKNAVYPITIDPLSTTPDSTPDDADQLAAQFGISVASAGDVNGDGYSDVIIGASGYDDGANTNEGRAFVYHGSMIGLPVTPNNTPDDADQINAFLGYSVASAGDINGDGYSDVIIGARGYDDGVNIDEGRAFIYNGSPAGLLTSPSSSPDDADQPNSIFGVSVACAGDVNGDGYSDVIIGAFQYDDGVNTDEGKAFVYHGSAGGLSNTPNSTPDDSNQSNAFFGNSVASAGDINGDGFSDVIIGSYAYDDGANANEGRAFVYHGSVTGISATPDNIPDDANLGDARFGQSVACAGDVNGDGYSDVIIGADRYDDGVNNEEGRCFVYYGSATGLPAIPSNLPDDANQADAFFGNCVASAGDVNGDGFSDVIIGASRYDDGANANEGRTFVYFGSATGLSATPDNTPDDADQANAIFGVSVASAGDVNGDGYSDVIIGAYFYDDGANTDEGRAFVYHGSAAGINTTATAITESNQISASLGFSVANAGDLNADGYSDVIVGAPSYDNGQVDEGVALIYHGSATGINTVANTILERNQANAAMGYAVASAGDVNGDGYKDVIVGAYLYDNGQIDEGVAFVYYGSVSGINIGSFVLLERNITLRNFGRDVSSAGDVNGDGYSDVIVGDPSNSNGESFEGGAFVFHGSAAGIITTIAATVESNQTNAQMGFGVASAGDVNGDGFSDVIAGAPGYGNVQFAEGAAYIYHGSVTGISTTPSVILESNQSNADMARRVSSAGDVNGDGFSDVIIGASLYDNGQTDEGVAFVYHGSATGINPTPAITLENNQTNSLFGRSTANAGDINGDGYSDVIVGAFRYDNGQIDEGAAYVYYGSITGINAIPNDMVESNQANVDMGLSVAGAGDVNGDGYSDVIVGAYRYDNGEADEGRAYVYHGNTPGTNKRNNLRLYNTDLVTPLNNTNFIIGNFGAGLYAKSFLGRDKGKLVWETRLNYNPYSGTPITNSTFFTALQSTYTDLGLNGVELKSLITKILGGRFTKLRARVKYNPTTAITGQVYGPWRNVSSIIDANHIGVLPINLISFTASWQQKGSTAKIDFVTDKEAGTCCFDIQKSSDGFSFTTIGTIAAKNTSGRQSYSFIDDKATNKKQYYRLKIKGTAWQIQYSNIQQLQNDKATEILVFPNPTADVLQLQLNKNYSSMNVQIVNALGQVVKQYNKLSTQNQLIQIAVKELAAGNYWLQLQSDGDKQVLQFVKQ
jgi:Secretion system C-terminal sorting domain/FG-GAP repeat/FG-GAP-like repeat